jgi:MYXO-CTERM domain-containing protein
VLLRNDDGMVDGCPDPFAAVEPRHDGGPAADPGPEPQAPDGGTGATKADGAVASDLGSTSGPAEVSDTQPVSDLDATVPTSENDDASQAGEMLARRSGCSCHLGEARTRGGLAIALLLGALLLATRRR